MLSLELKPSRCCWVTCLRTIPHIDDNALDTELKLRLNGFCQTIVVHQIPAEHGARQCRSGLVRFNDQNNLVVNQVFGAMIFMTVLIM